MPKFVYDLVEKTALQATMQGGYVPKQEIVLMLGTASQQYQNHLLERAANNKRTDTALAPFLRRQEYSANPASANVLPLRDGQFALPVDCAQVDYYDMPGADTVVEVDGYALRNRRVSPLVGPSAQYPVIATVENGDKQIYPADATRCAVQYYAYVPEPTYVETYDTNGNAVYDDAASVDVGWGKQAGPILIRMTVAALAQSTKDGQLAAMTEVLKNSDKE